VLFAQQNLISNGLTYRMH